MCVYAASVVGSVSREFIIVLYSRSIDLYLLPGIIAYLSRKL